MVYYNVFYIKSRRIAFLKEREHPAEPKIHGFSLSIFYMIVMIFTVVLTIFLSAVLHAPSRSYRVMQNTTEQYLLCHRSAEDVHAASDYLTSVVPFSYLKVPYHV